VGELGFNPRQFKHCNEYVLANEQSVAECDGSGCVVKVGMVTPKRAGILAQPSTGSATQSDRKRKSVVFTTVDLCDEESSSDGMAFSAPVHTLHCCYLL